MRLIADFEKKLRNFTLRVSFDTMDRTFAILGPSGSGKSMTLKCIAGIEKPDRGRILLGDRVLFDSDKKINLPAQKRQVGYLFQDYALFSAMTVRRNVLIGAKDAKEGEAYLKSFMLNDLANVPVTRLSGGQKQRVALARMLAAGPGAILLDEPFSALDDCLKAHMEEELFSLMDRFHGPMILVSHNKHEVYRIADRMAAIENGLMSESLDRESFFFRPVRASAAKLAGCRNISPLVMKEGRLYAADWGIELCPDKDDERVKAGAVGIYPSDLLEGHEEKAEHEAWAVLERVIEDLTSKTLVLRLDNEKVLYREIKKEAPCPVKGQRVAVYFPPDKLIRLDL